MPFVRPAPLSAWMLAGADRGVAPAVGDQLLGCRRIGGSARCAGAPRPGRSRARRAAARRAPAASRIGRRTSSSPAPASSRGRRDQRHLNSTVIAGYEELSTMPTSSLPTTGVPPTVKLLGAVHAPT